MESTILVKSTCPTPFIITNNTFHLCTSRIFLKKGSTFRASMYIIHTTNPFNQLLITFHIFMLFWSTFNTYINLTFRTLYNFIPTRIFDLYYLFTIRCEAKKLMPLILHNFCHLLKFLIFFPAIRWNNLLNIFLIRFVIATCLRTF